MPRLLLNRLNQMHRIFHINKFLFFREIFRAFGYFYSNVDAELLRMLVDTKRIASELKLVKL